MLREQMINFLQATVIFLLITNAFTTAAAVCAIRLLAGDLCKSRCAQFSCPKTLIEATKQ
jgi:hypothetical protein